MNALIADAEDTCAAKDQGQVLMDLTGGCFVAITQVIVQFEPLVNRTHQQLCPPMKSPHLSRQLKNLIERACSHNKLRKD